jgi:hypothetical protein
MTEMTPVLSSHILSVGHDPERGLIVEFVDGATVAYRGTPPELAAMIAKHESPGRALTTLVKGKFAHTYLTPPLRAPTRRDARRRGAVDPLA